MTIQRVVAELHADLDRRSDLAMHRAPTDLSMVELRTWLLRAYEDALDRATYLKAVLMLIDGDIGHGAQRLSLVDEDRVVSLYRGGMTLLQVARAADCSTRTVGRVLDRRGVERRKPSPPLRAEAGPERPVRAGLKRIDKEVFEWNEDMQDYVPKGQGP